MLRSGASEVGAYRAESKGSAEAILSVCKCHPASRRTSSGIEVRGLFLEVQRHVGAQKSRWEFGRVVGCNAG